jgi:hypothetical protein
MTASAAARLRALRPEVRAILAEARAACMTQCGSCASRDIECAVHVSVGHMLDGLDLSEDRAQPDTLRAKIVGRSTFSLPFESTSPLH